MKIFFINPPAKEKISREGRCMIKGSAWTAVFPPFSLVSSAAVLRKENFNVKVLDCIAKDIDFYGLKEEIRQFNPDIVVLNTTTPSIKEDLKVVELVKKNNLKTKVAVIGIHPSSLPDETLSLSKKLDYVIRGEPEFTIRDLALSLRGNQPLSKVKGISYRVDGKIFHNPPRRFIQDLDSLPFPAWDLIDASDYRLPFTDNPFLMIVPSRGCPYKCVFCTSRSYYGESQRLRSPENIVDEIAEGKNRFQVRDFIFWTESFTANRDFVVEIADKILKRKLKVRWICNSRVDNVDLELFKRIKRAGCWMISFGVESGCQEILNLSKKGITLEQSVNAIKLAREAGLQISAQFIIGLPGETKETALETLSFAKKLDADYVQFYCAVPFPGSELYEIAKRENWIRNYNWQNFNQSQSVLDIGTIKATQVMSLKRKFYLKYYLRIKPILRELRKLRSFGELKRFLRAAKDFLSWV